MKPSRYIRAYPCEGEPERRILFSPKKASIILLKEASYLALQNGTLSPSDEAVLARMGMVVEDAEDERVGVLGFFDRLNARNRVLNITVVLNLDCNFSCIYCYEGGLKGKLYMSQLTADHLIDFIKTHFIGEKNELLIDFYGGEPLLSIPLIRYISNAARAYTQSRGASYRFTLVTNGSLFKRKTAEELFDLGLESVKITLDGPAETHNRSRPYKSGAPSFDHIIGNILDAWDIVKIGIGGNFERHNYRKFVPLLDYLEEVGLTPDRIAWVKFDPVTKPPDDGFSPAGYKGGCASINEPWILDAEAFLREEILKRGYRTQKVQPVTCIVEMKDSYVVNFDGVIYKCPAFIGRKGYEAGDVENGVTDYTASYKIGYWKNEECAECDYLPLCFGGCRYMSFLRNGNLDALDCRKAYLDAALETLIKQEIKYSPKKHPAQK